MNKLHGRRREDLSFQDIPDDAKRGDYWKYSDKLSESPQNLTGTIWGYCSPIGGVGYLYHHTVREHTDGTISVRPNDGSSNSILVNRGDKSWHGFINQRVWEEC